MQKQAPSIPRILTMVVFSFSCFGLLLFLWLSFGGPIPLKPKGYRFEVAFPEATQLAVEADVRAYGVSIGKVRAKRRDPASNRTLATIEIDRKYAPIHQDAKAILRQKTLLGETFVELTPGTKRAPTIEEDGRLDQSQVAESVELDEILEALDPYTRKAFRTWQQDLGAAVEGRGRDLSDSFGNLEGFVESGGDLFQTLDEEREALRLLVRNTGEVFGALTESESQLRSLIERQDDVFTAISNEREKFAETWRIFPTFLDESKLTMERLESFSGKAEPVLRDLAPAMRDLEPTLRDLGTFSPDLKRFFVNFDPLITVSNKSLPATSEVLDGLRPVLVELGPFLQELNPLLQWIGVHVHTLSDMFANLGVATSAKVKNPTPGTLGHYLRQFGPSGAETLAIHPTRLRSNRGNAFPNPLGVIQGPAAPKFKVLPAWDCKNAGGEKEPGGDTPASPGCHVAKDFEYKGVARHFPHNDRDDYSK
jgi:phospholipid/cholesterol/gamma-HCH transport system substrate-binding protein